MYLMGKWVVMMMLCLGIELEDVHKVAKEVVEMGKHMERVQ